MSGMRTGDVVVGDGSWNLSIFVTDLQVRTSNFITKLARFVNA